MSREKEFGDFQTPAELAGQAIRLINALFGSPAQVIEPTAGLGTFLQAAYREWGDTCAYEGYEINPNYVQLAKQSLSSLGIEIFAQDFFSADWGHILHAKHSARILVVGNPPWATNSDLGSWGSDNLPKKTNFQRLKGFDAKTGKSNFDIAEWMLIRLIEALPPSGAVAMLCKTMTARKVLRHFWKSNIGLSQSALFRIDAKAHFDVSVDACLFYTLTKHSDCRTASVHSDLTLDSKESEFGWIDGQLVSDVDTYRRLRHLDGGSPYIWRSGVKHDASAIMELTPSKGYFVNGLNEKVDLETDYVYPLLKSSDLGNGRAVPRKAVLVTQRQTGDDTDLIKHKAPKTWAYLEKHAEKLDARKSSIYQNRPRFSIFGIGEYSFAPWKVAISGLYKSFCFVVVPPNNGKPVLVDDTCYSIACHSETEAKLICGLLNTEPAQQFLSSLVFDDSKRPITTEILRRISPVNLVKMLDRIDDLDNILSFDLYSQNSDKRQLMLVMDKQSRYKNLTDYSA